MARYLFGTSSVGMLSTLGALVIANWEVAAIFFGVTIIVLGLGLDWAVKLHYGEIGSVRPQFQPDLSGAEP